MREIEAHKRNLRHSKALAAGKRRYGKPQARAEREALAKLQPYQRHMMKVMKRDDRLVMTPPRPWGKRRAIHSGSLPR